MAHRVERFIETSLPQQAAFDFVSDFSTTEEWDPGIPRAKHLGEEPIGVGSRFELVSRFNKTEQTIVYEITACEPPSRVVLVGDSPNFHGVDEITFTPQEGGGTTVRYTADLSLKGAARFAEPFLRGRFDEMSDRAVAGLKTALDRRATAA